MRVSDRRGADPENLPVFPPGHLADLVHERVVALKATDAQEAAVRLFQAEGRAALPVTDSQGVLVLRGTLL